MADVQACPLCGTPIRIADLRPDGETIALDTIPVLDGPYRLVGDSQTAAEKVTRRGFQGYNAHRETCPRI